MEERKEEQKETTLSDLPLLILLNILSNLPVKELFNCRFVCKFWLSLVHSPRLAKLHLIRSSQKENNPSIILEGYSKDHYILDDIVDSNVAVMLQHPFKNEKFQVLGLCNGLICVDIVTDPFGDHTRFYVFNPITGEHLKIPELPFDYGYGFPSAGFCYHPLTDEYKILFAYPTHIIYLKDIWIHTLGSNSWRKIRDTESMAENSWWDVKLNGAVHWLSRGLPISSFDVGKEEFGVIEHPVEVSKMQCTLTLLGGCLSLSYTLDCGDYGDMDDEGIRCEGVMV